MGELRIERRFAVRPETVFAFVTETENLVKWWGPEGFRLGKHNLDLSRTGDWFFYLIDPTGGEHYVSGEVLSVDLPRSVEFTLIVHEQDAEPSIDSVVQFLVKPDGDGGSVFILTQTGLSREEIVKGSTQGWISTLGRLEKLLNET
jgi:uncharacterized protein YndB with AHSA1/START domain